MSVVVDMEAFAAQRLQEAWQSYLTARERAERSGDIRDGIAAGHAWKQWLTLFQSPSQNAADREFDQVVALRRRG